MGKYSILDKNLWGLKGQEICGQKTNLYDILWKILTFMKFCRDHYHIYENKIICISKASWEILNRTFFNRILKYNGG